MSDDLEHTDQSETRLVDFVADVLGEDSLRVEDILGDGFVRLRVSEAERRQAKHDIRCVEDCVLELLRNARDAGSARIFLATSREGSIRYLTCIDDGCGIPPEVGERIFDARVTSKLDTMCMDQWGVHGRGMALFSIRQNARSARLCSSEPERGSAFAVELDCTEIPERADQSMWPQVSHAADAAPHVIRGPHNIVRTAVEFALDVCPGLQVYIGSPTEILTTMVAGARRLEQRNDSLLSAHDDDLPLWMLPGRASDARDLVQRTEALGLEVSERTAYRILNGELTPLSSVAEAVWPSARHSSPDEESVLADQRGLSVAPHDLDDFSDRLEDAFKILGERYYLTLKDHPHIRIHRDTVTVSFDIEKQS